MKTGYLALEAKRAIRNPRFLMFTVAFPVILFLIEGGIFGNGDVPGTTIKYSYYLMVSFAAWGGFMASMNTGARTAVERSAGWQRQLRLTPLTPPGYLLGKAAVAQAVALPPIVLVSLVAALFQDVHMSPGNWTLTILGTWVACIPFAVLGLLVGQFATADNMQVFTTGLMILLGFLGGILFPVTIFPTWLANIAKVLPSYWLADIGHGPLLGYSQLGTGIAVLAAWTVVLAFGVARRYQRDSARV
ncbi:MAG TPA: ABC transporter permease [Pseudonocardiaceae bacterium]|jgi:ABC-2 type transport system permease protein|nr:ABC transporter permease [Pseudonocardiaceae bacterium]